MKHKRRAQKVIRGVQLAGAVAVAIGALAGGVHSLRRRKAAAAEPRYGDSFREPYIGRMSESELRALSKAIEQTPQTTDTTTTTPPARSSSKSKSAHKRAVRRARLDRRRVAQGKPIVRGFEN